MFVFCAMFELMYCWQGRRQGGLGAEAPPPKCVDGGPQHRNPLQYIYIYILGVNIILTWKTCTYAESVGNEGVKLPCWLRLVGAARKTPTRGSGGAF